MPTRRIRGAVFAAARAMFHLETGDYVRLTYESLKQAYEAHAEAAAKLSRFSSYFRLATLALTGGAAVLSAIAMSGGRATQVAAAVLAACAFGACATYIGYDQQPRIYGHRASAARIWVIVEKYRALVSDLDAGTMDTRTLHERRNALLYEASDIFERVAPDDRFTFDIARRALGGRAARPDPATPPPPPAAARP